MYVWVSAWQQTLSRSTFFTCKANFELPNCYHSWVEIKEACKEKFSEWRKVIYCCEKTRFEKLETYCRTRLLKYISSLAQLAFVIWKSVLDSWNDVQRALVTSCSSFTEDEKYLSWQTLKDNLVLGVMTFLLIHRLLIWLNEGAAVIAII